MDGTIPDLKGILEKESVNDLNTTKFNSLDSMRELLEAVDTNTNNSLNKSWSKLNKTDKLKLINNYIEVETSEKNINKSKLEKLLHTSFKNGLLNKQSVVEYDVNKNVINDIKIFTC